LFIGEEPVFVKSRKERGNPLRIGMTGAIRRAALQAITGPDDVPIWPGNEDDRRLAARCEPPVFTIYCQNRIGASSHYQPNRPFRGLTNEGGARQRLRDPLTTVPRTRSRSHGQITRAHLDQ